VTTSRREFLKTTGAIGLWAASSFIVDATAWAQAEGFWLLACAGLGYGQSKELLAPSQPGQVLALNPHSKEKIAIDVPFFGHEVVTHPQHPSTAFSSIKWGKHAAILDFKLKKMLSLIESPSETRFFGHAAFSDDGKTLYASCHNDKAARGEIIVYGSSDLKIKDRWPTGGRFPHQILVHKDQLIVLNQFGIDSTGRPHSKLSHLNIHTGLIESAAFSKHPGLAHFAFDGSRDEYWLGGFLSGQMGKKGDSLLENLKRDKPDVVDLPSVDKLKIQGELLSLQVSPMNPELLALTVSDAQFLAIYDLQKKLFIAQHKLDSKAKGICFSTTESDLLYVNEDSGKLSTLRLNKSGSAWSLKVLSQVALGNGSHLHYTNRSLG
jgi:hypothetical protein